MDKCWNPISKAILASLVAASANAASYQGTFTAAAVDIFDGSALSGTTFSVLPNGTPVLVERGPSASGAHGKARAERDGQAVLRAIGEDPGQHEHQGGRRHVAVFAQNRA